MSAHSSISKNEAAVRFENYERKFKVGNNNQTTLDNASAIIRFRLRENTIKED